MTLRDYLKQDGMIEIRGDGRAGGGLLLAMESFAKSLSLKENIHYDQWPLFSSSRRGAPVRAFMRISEHPIHTATAVVSPHMSIVVDESTTEQVDFASGMKSGIYILNSRKKAKEIAKNFKLSGTIVTVDGDGLGEKFFGSRIGNISVFAAIVRMSGIVNHSEGRTALEESLKKRRLPKTIQEANLKCYDESLGAMDIQEVDEKEAFKHELPLFEGFPLIPIGAQSSLRTSLKNRTSFYRPAGLKLTFEDPKNTCSGCSLCLTNCPENIISFVPDEKRGVRVTGANVIDFCKLCRECVEVCPIHLFKVEEEAAH